jgi:DNA mismatch endonuclease (patch repair protein)
MTGDRLFSGLTRSELMSRIKGTGNKKTELRLIQIFRANGMTGWKRGCSLPLAPRSSKPQGSRAKSRSTGRVKPDFVFQKSKIAMFVDGCFWHGCPKHATQPKTNAAFWREKIARNQARDRQVNRLLRAKGWKVVRVWEHALRRRDETKLVRRLRRLLPGGAWSQASSRIGREWPRK